MRGCEVEHAREVERVREVEAELALLREKNDAAKEIAMLAYRSRVLAFRRDQRARLPTTALHQAVACTSSSRACHARRAGVCVCVRVCAWWWW